MNTDQDFFVHIKHMEFEQMCARGLFCIKTCFSVYLQPLIDRKVREYNKTSKSYFPLYLFTFLFCI